MDTSRPYQVCLYAGPTPPQREGVNVVDLTPAQLTPEAVLEALRASGLSPADMRSRVLVEPDTDARTAVLLYAALIGFAGRRLDVSVGGQAHQLAGVDAAARAQQDIGRPAEPLEQVQVGGPARQDMPHTDISAGFGPVHVSGIRYARRVRFVPSQDTLAALGELTAIAGMRGRGKAERLPYLCTGDEPAPTPETATDIVGICLDTLRREAEELRRSLRSDNRESLAEPGELSQRNRTLLRAAAVPIEEVLTRLGTKIGEGGEDWHCPRPERHTNGDANASMKIARGKARCFRCDPERVDSLRLAMDVLGCSADEAADWLLSDAVLKR